VISLTATCCSAGYVLRALRREARRIFSVVVDSSPRARDEAIRTVARFSTYLPRRSDDRGLFGTPVFVEAGWSAPSSPQNSESGEEEGKKTAQGRWNWPASKVQPRGASFKLKGALRRPAPAATTSTTPSICRFLMKHADCRGSPGRSVCMSMAIGVASTTSRRISARQLDFASRADALWQARPGDGSAFPHRLSMIEARHFVRKPRG